MNKVFEYKLPEVMEERMKALEMELTDISNKTGIAYGLLWKWYNKLSRPNKLENIFKLAMCLKTTASFLLWKEYEVYGPNKYERGLRKKGVTQSQGNTSVHIVSTIVISFEENEHDECSDKSEDRENH